MLCNLLEPDSLEGLSLHAFSVMIFDECHHATKSHPYAKILRYVEQLKPEHRPRIVGLSASLIQSNTIEGAVEKLKKIEDIFGGATIYKPSIVDTSPPLSWRVVKITTLQQTMFAVIESRIEALLSSLSSSKIKKDCIFRSNDKETWKALFGYMSTHYMATNYPKLARAIPKLIRAAEVNDLLGPFMSYTLCADVFESPSLNESSFMASLRDSDTCPRLEELKSVLSSLDGKTSFSQNFKDNVTRKDEMNDEEALRDSGEDVMKRFEPNLEPLSRILLFVETRDAAKLMFHFLSSADWAASYNCMRVVGHGGIDGQRYRGEGGQEEAIKQFRSGACRLLISTTVLEEGQDISCCNLVIRYGGPASYIQIVQSKGRARAVGGKLIVIATEEEQIFIDKVTRQKAIADRVLPSTPEIELFGDDKTRGECPLDEEYLSQLEGAQSHARPFESSESYPFCLEVYIPGISSSYGEDIARIQEAVRSSLRFCTVLRIDVMLPEREVELGTTSFFSSEYCRVLIYGEGRQFFFRDDLPIWDFTIQSKEGRKEAYAAVPGAVMKKHKPIAFAIQGLTTGFFTTRKMYTRMSDIGIRSGSLAYSTLSIEPGLHVTLIGDTGKIEFAVQDIDSYVCLSVVFNAITLYVPLKHVPKVYAGSTKTNQERVSVPHSNSSPASQASPSPETDLAALSLSSILAIEVPMQCFDELISALGDVSCLGVPAFFSRINPNVDFSLNDLRQFTDLSAGFDLTMSLDRDVYWEFQLLCSERVDPWALLKIREHVVVSGCSPVILRALKMMKLYRSLRSSSIAYYQKYLCLAGAQKEDSDVDLELTPPEGHVLIRRVVFTPSRFYILPSIPLRSSRFIRKHASDDIKKKDILLVSFRDERFQRIYSSKVFNGRFLEIITRGFRVDKEYSFALGSNSMIRDQSALFITGSSEDVLRMRRDLIPRSAELGVKLMSRLGLFCTADTPTLNIGNYLSCLNCCRIL